MPIMEATANMHWEYPFGPTLSCPHTSLGLSTVWTDEGSPRAHLCSTMASAPHCTTALSHTPAGRRAWCGLLHVAGRSASGEALASRPCLPMRALPHSLARRLARRHAECAGIIRRTERRRDRIAPRSEPYVHFSSHPARPHRARAAGGGGRSESYDRIRAHSRTLCLRRWQRRRLARARGVRSSRVVECA